MIHPPCDKSPSDSSTISIMGGGRGAHLSYHLVGIAANLLNGLSLIPSISHVYATGDLDSYPTSFLVAMIVANLLWIVYGYGVGASQTLIMGAIFTAYYAFFLYLKLVGTKTQK